MVVINERMIIKSNFKIILSKLIHTVYLYLCISLRSSYLSCKRPSSCDSFLYFFSIFLRTALYLSYLLKQFFLCVIDHCKLWNQASICQITPKIRSYCLLFRKYLSSVLFCNHKISIETADLTNALSLVLGSHNLVMPKLFNTPF